MSRGGLAAKLRGTERLHADLENDEDLIVLDSDTGPTWGWRSSHVDFPADVSPKTDDELLALAIDRRSLEPKAQLALGEGDLARETDRDSRAAFP